MKRIFVYIALTLSLFGEEVSVFGAGNLNSDAPYGLTQTEKKIYENMQNIRQLLKEKRQLESDIEELKNTITTLQTMIASLGKRSKENETKIETLTEDLKENNLITEISLSNIKKDINRTKSQVEKQKKETKKTLNQKIKEEFQKVNHALQQQEERLRKIDRGFNREFKRINKKLVTIGKKIEKINSNYVTQKQLDFVVQKFNSFRETVIGEFEKLAKNSNQEDSYDFSKHTNSEIFKEGKRKIEIGKYKEAIKLFSYLIKQHYRPATDNFYIGECYYFLGDYQSAIAHYKESVAIYDKSSFMPTLLLHSGNSLEKLDDIEQAKRFYQTLIQTYPKSKEAKKAKRHLERLEKLIKE